MQICGLQKVTVIDFPGRVAATIFLCGCNFRCPWCYAPHLVLPEEIEKQPKIAEKELFDFLKERRGLLDGVCVCGGEPALYKELPEFIKKIKELSFLVKLDTNGSNPEMLKKLINEKLIDYVAMDIKAPKEKYDKAVGIKVDLNKIKKSIELIKNSGIDYEFRTTVVPGIHTKEDIIKIAQWIGGNPSTGSGQGRYYLQNFRSEKTIDPKFSAQGGENIKPYPDEYLLEIQKAVAPFFEICQIR